jgi:hypothetical protein
VNARRKETQNEFSGRPCWKQPCRWAMVRMAPQLTFDGLRYIGNRQSLRTVIGTVIYES